MEQIEFYCAFCGDSLRAPPDSAGAPIRCPACHSLGSVPLKPVQSEEAADGSKVFSSELLSIEIRFRCGACRQKLQVSMQSAGKILNCPACRALVKAPKWPGALAQRHAADSPTSYLAELTLQEVELLSAVPDEDERKTAGNRS